MTNQPHYEPSAERNRRARLEDHFAQLGTRDPFCAYPSCPERRPFAMTGHHPDILCYEHRCAAEGRRSDEAHHVAGQHNSPVTAQVPGNDHRLLSDLQRDWPVRTVRNPDASPLIWAAAAIRGLLDVLWVILHSIAWIPPFLEWLDEQLCDLWGAEWWLEFGLLPQQ